MSTPSDQRTIVWFESNYDLQQIANNNWQFQIAKMVTTGNSGTPTSNIIWQSVALQPSATISWHVDYALNWTVTLPGGGVTVTLSGDWQACAKGESYDLNNLGEWVASSSGGTAGWLGVGNVGYQYPGNPGIHIVVGVKNAVTGNYDPIFIDQTKLFLNSSATYQPQEEIIWWLSSSNLTGSVYYNTQGAQGGVDLSGPAPNTNQYEYWTTYLVGTGSWVNSQTAPPNGYTAPPASEVAEVLAPTLEVFVWPWIGAIGLTAAVSAAKQKVVKADLTVKLSKTYSSVDVDFESTSGLKIKFTLSKGSSAAPGSLDALGYTAGDDPKDDVAAAVNAEIKAGGTFPDGEKWKWES